MCVPQRPVAAPGATLLEQLTYPSTLPDSPDNNIFRDAAQLLHDVGLADLLMRVNGDWLKQEDWQGQSLAACCSCHMQLCCAGLLSFIISLSYTCWVPAVVHQFACAQVGKLK